MRTIWMLLPAMLFFAACEDEGVDISNPVMEIQQLTPAPKQGEVCGAMEDTVFNVSNGQTLDFIVLFKDDAALSQYKIDIHNNFDCHGHGGASTPGVALPNITNQTTDWNLQDIVSLAGQEALVERSLEVPENVTAGTYHFQIQILDESGNDNPLANVYSIKALNARDIEAPQMSVIKPAGDFSSSKGDAVSFEGTVTDNYSLSEGGNGLLFLTYTDLSSGNTFTTNAVFPFDNTVDKSYDFNFDYTVPNTLTAGTYLFTLRAHDGVRNVAEVAEFEVEIE